MKYYVIKRISDGMYLKRVTSNQWTANILESATFNSIDDIHALVAADKKRNVAHRFLSRVDNLSIIEVTLSEKHICDL